MKQTPLVSVIMPCYNAAQTLPWALGSVLVQTYTNWELIFVDDGSTDESAAVVESVSDSRIRLIRFPVNRGRPYARQVALEAARGEYLSMLDADDWIYPEKLTRQLEILSRNPNTAAVGAGLMVFDSEGNPFGVQGARSRHGGLERGVVNSVSRPPFFHGPMMLQMTVAKKSAYDLALDRGQDTDFLVRALWGKSYALLCEPLYAYRELDSITYEKVRKGLSARLVRYRKYREINIINRYASWREYCKTQAKRSVYWAAHHLGFFPALVRRRSAPPTTRETQNFWDAQSRVSAAADEIVDMLYATR